MASTSSCTIGITLENVCHKTTYSQEIGLINFNVLSQREKLLYELQLKKYQIFAITRYKFISSDM